ncbi:diguanylate cyclase domain-containing protein [Alloyangia pacifica]|uniref:GGDEF domain-containing protein, diguanylate cyclase (C-di-GMP synthetase) or its enzymatically inactive variants n=1 Tax=Alloyangia pacifica TaxID=311180 RepID=A0A1I6PUV1_9RHOB|nr:diguanylate cyclase [Alloyangia pacifica]SDG36145.1 GGDEF domain-containing protein, diguanylate cyclase (c-di-GMP synthetase) or its enzymatically inactive variants [Alloyangia pacifica]SFS44007.1 GGDEF domain-containing protein, diguanylate cyclase (c-di-GMP synthetase) or its enzymatically inactive variants [Alloyangia pacifica]
MDYGARFHALKARDGVFLSPSHPSLRPLAWTRKVCLVLAGAVLLVAAEGHIYGISRLYAPAGESALSLPTLLAGTGAVAATMLQRPLRRSSQRETLVWALVIAVCLITGLGYRAGIEFGAGRMGLNTAISYVLLAGGQLCYRRLPMSSFGLSIMALGLPFVAAIGYLNNAPLLFGQMSLSTSALLLALGVANVARHARKAVLRPLVSGSKSGRAVRGILLAWLALVASQAVSVRFVPAPLLPTSGVAVMVVDALAMLAVILFLGMKYDANATRLRLTEWRLYNAALRDPATGMRGRASAELYSATFGPITSHGLILIEIDDLGALSQRFGPASAERVLRLVAARLQRDLSPEELLCREEELGLLLMCRNCTIGTLGARAEELCALAADLRDPEREMMRIDLSAAAVMARRGDGELGPAIRRARAALRQSRSGGSPRVVLCEAA